MKKSYWMKIPIMSVLAGLIFVALTLPLAMAQPDNELFRENMFEWVIEQFREWLRGNETATILGGGGTPLDGQDFKFDGSHYVIDRNKNNPYDVTLQQVYNSGSEVDVNSTDVVWNLSGKSFVIQTPNPTLNNDFIINLSYDSSEGTQSSYFKIVTENGTVFSVGRTTQNYITTGGGKFTDSRVIESGFWQPFEDDTFDLGSISCTGYPRCSSDWPTCPRPACTPLGGSCQVTDSDYCQQQVNQTDCELQEECFWDVRRWRDLFLAGAIKGTGSGETLFMNASTGEVRFANRTFNVSSSGSLNMSGSVTVQHVDVIDNSTGYQIGGITILRNVGTDNLMLGEDAGLNVAGGNNLCIGSNAGKHNSAGVWNLFLGSSAGFISTGSYNIFIGSNSARQNTGNQNVFIGRDTGYYSGKSDENVFIGEGSGVYVTGSDNVLIGSRVAYINTTGTEARNVVVGYKSGYNLTGSDNVFIGYKAGYTSTGSNLLIIDNQNRGSSINETSQALMYGIFDLDPNDQHLNINANVNISGNLILNDSVGMTGNFSVGSCWIDFTQGIAKSTNCTAY